VRWNSSTILGLALLVAASGAQAENFDQPHFTSLMNSTFGVGNWRQTGGYRTQAREDQLRAEGAMTVPPGVLSRHSMGRSGAPGAYDLVVDGLTPSEAAARLFASRGEFRRLLPEGAHGTQGAHLHVEPLISGAGARRAVHAAPEWTVAAPTPAELALTQLRQAAIAGQMGAQLALASAYEQGRAVPKDLVAAYVWATAATDSQDPEERRGAAERLTVLAAKMRPDEMRRAQMFAQRRDFNGCDSSVASETTVVVLGVDGATNGNTDCLKH
jgi:hypothetical protein